jgi:hypothetical protein
MRRDHNYKTYNPTERDWILKKPRWHGEKGVLVYMGIKTANASVLCVTISVPSPMKLIIAYANSIISEQFDGDSTQ